MNREQRLALLSAYLDGELSEADRRWLAAWSERCLDDRAEFESLAEIVRLVRELPQADPPAGLRERILRACAVAVPVEVPRAQALEWLDKYFDGELAAPQGAVVEHYLAVDPEFAETARVHQQMIALLGDVDEVEPPRDLRRRIEADVARIERGLMPARRRRAVFLPGFRRLPQSVRFGALAAAAVAAMVWLGALTSPDTGGTSVAEDPAPAFVTPDQVDNLPGALDEPPAPGEMPLELPSDDGADPVIRQGMPRAPRVAPFTPRPEAGNVASDEREPSQPIPSSGLPAPPKAVPELAPAPLPGSASGGELAGDDRTSQVPTEAGRGADSAGLDGNQPGGANRLDSRGTVDPTRHLEAPPF